MYESEPILRAADLLVLAVILIKKQNKYWEDYDNYNSELRKENCDLKKENDSLRKKLNGRQFQIDQVKSGKAKPSYRGDITPEKVQVLYDKLKNKSAVARELGVDRRLIDRRLKEMQMRKDNANKQ